MREICLGSNSTATGSNPDPYTTAGILPATRTRRAAFLLNLPSRGVAATASVFVVAAMIDSSFRAQNKLSVDRSPFSDKERQTKLSSLPLPFAAFAAVMSSVLTDNRELKTEN